MREYFKVDPWNIIEEGLDKDYNEVSESAMSIGNGHMGCRGNFEEYYSGKSLQGTYIAGVYYPDKTRVGWWKNGYPEYFAKVLNGANFIGIDVYLNGTRLDLNKYLVEDFKRVLNMQEGYLLRTFKVTVDGNKYEVEAKRFFSMAKKEVAAIRYSVKPLDAESTIQYNPFIDADVRNKDSNYDEMFWTAIEHSSSTDVSSIVTETKKTGFRIAVAMCNELSKDTPSSHKGEELFVSNTYEATVAQGEALTLTKYIAVTTNRDLDNDNIKATAEAIVKDAKSTGFDALFTSHQEAWARLWEESDIIIEGDDAAQQGIRFNIYHLKQTYTGDDSRLNIGPKGFTGEKYGGSTYWDTEAYCIPFFLSTAPEHITKQLLIYRYNQLDKAKENAAKLGLEGALYPMVTMNGEECHNEWEITFEEIHRNGAIAYAIFNYVRYTNDKDYLAEYGFDVLVEISRFWASRVHFNPRKDKYMMLGVTGPNEYENNINNNWYTNTMATWTMEYTLEAMDYLKAEHTDRYKELSSKLNIRDEEITKWQDIMDKMYYPVVEDLGVFEQQDGFMDKDLINVADLPEEHLPLNQKWSWDKILRSCFIKQADVLQGMYFFSDRYDFDTKKKNFDFYEPMTVHESSLSPCIHSILAAEIGYEDKAVEMYVRTARLDLDNYNNDTEDGLHITSMAGTWMSVVQGFGGLKVTNDMLTLNPFIPKAWDSFSFRVTFRNRILNVKVDNEGTTIDLLKGEPLTLVIYNKEVNVAKDTVLISK
ncbi:glycoside hydrolase family 65 protein [Vallitalea okinawensis]|uniref:glycoside hydrolase family 65 protein n=1 Tax=Vallitalea okinawensis TaxID=2078660 RepID=UPI000CFAC8E6|nr:glycoside hydrolase family 65 protein [Vallitalea okinawensis]